MRMCRLETDCIGLNVISQVNGSIWTSGRSEKSNMYVLHLPEDEVESMKQLIVEAGGRFNLLEGVYVYVK